MIGVSGIEISLGIWQETYQHHISGDETRGVFEYEMGRNFWLYGGKLQSSKKPEYHLATAFATVFGYYAGLAGGSTDQLGYELVDWVNSYHEAFLGYLQNPNWLNIEAGGQPSAKIIGGLWMYLGNIYGQQFFQRFFDEVSRLSDAVTLTDAVDNFIRASSYGARNNLYNWFVNKLQYPASASLFAELNSKWPPEVLLAGLTVTTNGRIYYTPDLGTWVNIPGLLNQLQLGDLDGDGHTDLAGVASNGSIWYTTNLSTWTQVPGGLAQLRVGDLNGNGKADLAGLASNGSIWYTTNLTTWTQVPGGLAQLRVGDFNGDGKADLAGLASNGSIWYTTNLGASWTNIPGLLSQIVVGDLNGDGHADLAGIAGNGTIWYTTNLSTWNNIPGQLSQLRTANLSGDGHADLAGIAGNGTIWYTTNLSAWTNIPGQLATLAGD